MSGALDNPIFTDADKAREHLEAQRWPNGAVCPHCGNAALRGVHDLDVIDKHRGLLADFAEVKWPYGGAGVHLSSSIHPDRFRVGGYCVAELAIERGFIVGEKLPAELNLTFPTGGPFSGLPLVPTLRDLTTDFSRIIDAFEALLFGALTNPPA